MFQGVNTDTDIGWEVAEEFRTVLSKRDHLVMANLGSVGEESCSVGGLTP